MNILVVTPEYLPYGDGIANVVYALRGHMLRMGVNVDVLSRGGADINLTNWFTPLGLAGLVPFWHRAAGYIEKMAKDYDVVWLHAPLLMSARKLSTQKLVASFHSTYYGFYRAYKAHAIGHLLPYYYFATNLERHFFRELSYIDSLTVTAVSPFVANELRANGLERQIHVIPNGLSEQSSNLQEKVGCRKHIASHYRIPISKSTKILLYVGRLTEVKQPLSLIEFFKKLVLTHRDASLIVVGEGNLIKKIKQISSTVPNCFILGGVSSKDIPALYSAADAFVSLSCYEGLPLAVLDAIAFSLPLILSDIPIHRWIIRSNLGHGILVDPIKPEVNLHETVSLLEKVSLRCKEESVNLGNFNWNNITNRYLALLNKPLLT